MSENYPGLWVRIKAFAADYIVISLYIILLVLVSLFIQSVHENIITLLFGNPLSGQLAGFISITLPVTLYFAISESSSHQATWGKRWQKIKVVDSEGKRVSFLHALGRTTVKFIPWELAHTCIWQMSDTNFEPRPIIIAGFILVWLLVGIYLITLLISSKNQALYDQITNTLVLKNNHTFRS